MPYPDPRDVLKIQWYAKPNDLIGGWCIMPVEEMPSQGCWTVGDFLSQGVAEHVASLHNYRLVRLRPFADGD